MKKLTRTFISAAPLVSAAAPTEGDDVIIGTAFAETLHGYAGADTISGDGGNDVLYGDDGSDILDGGAGDDTLYGGAGADRLTGGSGNDVFSFAFAYPRSESSPSTIDVITDFEGAGVAGGDWLNLPSTYASRGLIFNATAIPFSFDPSGNGGDQLPAGYIGDGFADVSWFYNAGANRVEIWVDADDNGQFSEEDQLIYLNGVTTLSAGDFVDTFTYYRGTTGADSWSGDAANNTAYGLAGNDILDGGAGADAIFGDAGDDIIYGGEGDDLGGSYDYLGLHGGAGDDQIHGGNGNDTLLGEEGNDTLYGDAGADRLRGGAGNDSLYGGDDDDDLEAYQGSDTLYGEGGNDTLSSLNFGGTYTTGTVHQLFGGDGNDRITLTTAGSADGGAGDDLISFGFNYYNTDASQTITGGSGADTFTFHLSTNLADADTITDFSRAEGDRLSGYQVAYCPSVFRSQMDASLLVVGAALPGGDLGTGFSQYFYAHSGGKTYLVIDAWGNNILDADDAVLAFDGLLTLSASDFVDGTFTIAVGTPVADTMNGATGDDQIYSVGGADTVYGNDGRDTIYGGGGNDVIWGGAGNDGPAQVWEAIGLYGEAGDDTIYGEAGADKLSGGDGNDMLNGGIGIDTILGDAGNDTAYGGLDNDSITGGVGDDWLYGEDGDDTLSEYTYGGTNHLYGGAGNDNLTGGTGDDFLYGGDGNDSINVFDGVNYVEGGAGNDYIYVSGESTVDGGEGDDDIWMSRDGGTAFGTATGGLGADRFHIGVWSKFADPTRITDFNAAEGDIIDLYGAGAASYQVDGLPSAFRGLLSSTTLTLGIALPGQDLGSGFAQFWTLQDGTNTYLIYDRNRDYLLDANDMVVRFDGTLNLTTANFLAGNFPNIVGTAAGETITGTAATDTIYGLGGADTITALDGRDLVHGGEGNDIIWGGAGDDSNQSYTVYGLYGGGGDDTIYGEAGTDFLYGETGADWLYGGSGNDRLEGGDGDDHLFAGTNGSGEEGLYGGAGNDVLDASESTTARLEGGEGDDSITGSATIDYILGDAGNDTVHAGDGGDAIIGGMGDDVLFGEAGNDEFHHGSGNDVIDGGEGNDIINFGGNTATVDYSTYPYVTTYYTGSQTLTGGAGADRFIFKDGADLATIDTITDFNAAEGDRLELFGVRNGMSDSYYGFLGTATLFAGELAIGTPTIGAVLSDPHEYQFVQVFTSRDANFTYVIVDRNSSGRLDASDYVVRLTGNVAIDAASFVAGTFNSVAGTNLVDNLTGDTLANYLMGGAGNDTLSGLGGMDYIVGGSGADTIYGGEGDDWHPFVYYYSRFEEAGLIGGLGNDAIYGGAGRDGIAGNEGNDTLDGGTGEDWIWGGVGLDTIYGAEDADRLFGEDGDDLIDGGFGNDTIEGGLGADRIFGNADDDQIYGDINAYDHGAGNDYIDGGDGNDRIAGNGGSDTILGGAGNDYIEGDDGPLSYYNPYVGNDTMDGGAGDDTIYGYDGNDVIQGGLGNDSLYGGGGIDTLSYVSATGGVTVDLAVSVQSNGEIAGVDTIADFENLTGSNSADVLSGNALDNIIRGAGGNDSLAGRDGRDRLQGGAGADALDGGAGIDTAVYAGSSARVIVSLISGTGRSGDSEGDTLTGIENIVGSDYADRLVGDGAANTLEGASGDDTLIGNGGADILIGGLGADDLQGGAGSDVYYVDDAGDLVTELAGAGFDRVVASVNWTLAAHVDNLDLTGTALEGRGNDLVNQIRGNGLDNLLFGYAGNDTLIGLDGNDTLDGGGGVDTLIGGLGDDIYYVDTATDKVIEAVGQGIDEVRSSVSWTLSAGLDNLTLLAGATRGIGNNTNNVITADLSTAAYLEGLSGDDTLTGSLLDDQLHGQNGIDTLFGLNGNDLMTGGSGNDTLNGGGGDDELRGGTENDLLLGMTGNDLLVGDQGTDDLRGGDGNDRLIGGSDNDILFGGTGADVFAYLSSADFAGNDAATCERIRDFSKTEGDKIDLSIIDANMALAGNQQFSFIGSAGFSNTAGELRFDQFATYTVIYGDTNGDGIADFALRLNSSVSIDGGDFIP